MKRLENIYDITKRLCGMIEPQGESNVDAVRLENLKDTIDLSDKLIRDILSVIPNKYRYEASMKKAGEMANEYIDELRNELIPEFRISKNDIERLQSKVHAITGDGEVMKLFNELLGIGAG